jgi:signal transduction histidine kinase
LRKIESAALAMSRGDLQTPVESGHQILELARVFEALETMRSKISELLAREREAEADRRELIANLSHDLRTPLSAIRGYVDGLREGIANTPEMVARYLSVLGKKIQDLDRMIGQIFLLSTLEAHEAPQELRLFDLRAFLRDSVEELRLSVSADLIHIDDEGLEGSPCTVLADPLQLRRAMENLVDNAVRHGGRCPINVTIGLTERSNRAELRVEDNGRGIPPAEAARVFDRFSRSDPSRSGGGVGLGLAIARRIVEAHGGTIRLESRAEGLAGARFIIELPFKEAPG